jgi:hypothetical protein
MQRFYAAHIVRTMFVNYVRDTLNQVMVTFAYGQHKFKTSAKNVSITRKHPIILRYLR